MSDGGKGSGRRPGTGFQDAWERIFRPSAHAAHAVHELAHADRVQVVQTPPKKGVCTCTCTRSVGVGGERVQRVKEEETWTGK
jgi:hypothetical protein